MTAPARPHALAFDESAGYDDADFSAPNSGDFDPFADPFAQTDAPSPRVSAPRVASFDYASHEEASFAPPPEPLQARGEAVEFEFAGSGTLADQPVPRIDIAAFCELPETAGLVQECSRDRRMARAHVAVEMGGLPAAIEKYHDESTPNLVIIETGMRGRSLFEQLDELANVCDPGTKVVVIGAANDIGLYRELMRRGVSEYLVPPLTPVALMRAVAQLFTDPDEPFFGKTVAFIGAKGGAGSSSIAHNVAWCVAETIRIDTTIVDLDLSFGTASLDFNHDASQGVADALAQPDRVDDVLLERLVTRLSDRLNLFTAPGSLDREWELPPEAYETVVQAIRRTTPMVILDLPHVWAPWLKQVLFAADQVVITATPELASLRNAKNIYDLVAGTRPNDAPPLVVLNQVGVPKRPEIPVKDFAEALGSPPALVMPFDAPLFGLATNNGQMVCELKGYSKSAEGLRLLAQKLTGREAAPRKSSFLSKIMSR